MKGFLVDDDPDDSGLFQDALKNIDKNTEFSYLGDCNAVVDYLNTYTPDIIFLDVHLPKISGIQCLRNIRFHQQYKTLPIIMYSSNFNKQYTDMCKKEKANHFFVKPNSFRELEDIIRKMLTKEWSGEMSSDDKDFIISYVRWCIFLFLQLHRWPSHRKYN